MRTKKVSFDELKEFIGQREDMPSDNRRHINRMSAAVRAALQNELTERQQTCIHLYFFEKQTIPQIALQLGINKSTVSRHLAKGKKSIKKVVAYVCADQLAGVFFQKP